MPDPIIPGGPNDPTGGSAVEVQSIEAVPEPIYKRLRYGSPLHKEVLARLTNLRDMGKKRIEEHWDVWNRVDEHHQMHLDLTRYAIKGDGSTDTDAKEMPVERGLVVPMSFAIEKALLMQLMSLFMGRDPMFQYEGVGPEDVVPAKLIEAVVGYDLRRSRMALITYATCQSAIRYGIAPIHAAWREKMGWVMKPLIEEPGLQGLAAIYPELAILLKPIRQWGVKSAYTHLESVDPYRFRFDPRASVFGCAEGNIVGHERTESLLYFEQGQLERGDGPYFNIDSLRKYGHDSGSSYRTMGYEPGDKEEWGEETYSYDTEHLEVRLIPVDWNLGDSDRAEVWWFEWCGDEVIVRAHKSPYQAADYNYVVGESLPDLHTVTNPGYGEQLESLQRFMNWHASAHLDNVRRFVNNAALIMERFIEIEDVEEPVPAGHIRATQEAQELVASGMVSDPRVFFPQLQLYDVTKQHVEDLGFMMELGSRMTGVNDPVQSIPLSTRRTATEIETLRGMASQRVMLVAQALDGMVFGPLAEMMAGIRQQFTTEEGWYRIPGELAADVMREMQMRGRQAHSVGGLRTLVAPGDLYGNFDYQPFSAIDPPNPSRFAETLIELLNSAGNFPQLFDPQAAMMMGETEIIDAKKLIIRIGEALKIKDVRHLFKPLAPPNINVVPDEQMQAMVAAGNAVPATEVQ